MFEAIDSLVVYGSQSESRHMRCKSILFACFLIGQPAQADTVQVPELPDGSVDVEQVMSGFEIVFPMLSSDAQTFDFSGQILGEGFIGSFVEADPTGGFSISIDAPTLSEHANFLIAVLATDTICLRKGLRPGPVLWSETKDRKGSDWEVSTSCSPLKE
ncbi:hypothetical protein RM543_15980 [Roseicyclus sp. F158]|uniref:Uncharacterized protein n=1 Tax=Tropicimonas omnivorans TaxID=3075590 RepID=A0ABU3DKD7_9RHOB|nr:hypothetical protein [Roseicyclus sp. F158]MDT0684184.1 hypothetical protein [Roseicyclus sp. F158]